MTNWQRARQARLELAEYRFRSDQIEHGAIYARINAMAGLDENGQIAPPPEGFTIDRTPMWFWSTDS